MNNKAITKREAERLLNILTNPSFGYSKCSAATQIKLVRTQILLEPVAEEVRKALKTAQEKYLKPEMVPLIEKLQQDNTLKGDDARVWSELYPVYEKMVSETVEPVFNTSIAAKLDRLTLGELEEVLESNKEWMTGDIPKFLLLNLVDDIFPGPVEDHQRPE